MPAATLPARQLAVTASTNSTPESRVNTVSSPFLASVNRIALPPGPTISDSTRSTSAVRSAVVGAAHLHHGFTVTGPVELPFAVNGPEPLPFTVTGPTQ